MLLFSICVPVYNVERYIERCARSLFDQTFKDIEFIFVDDCSRDNSFAILQQVSSQYPGHRIKLMQLEKNGGPHAARMKALENASGEYVYFVDSDDWIDPNMFDLMSKKIRQSSPDVIGLNQCNYENNQIIKRYLDFPESFNEWFTKAVTCPGRVRIGLNGFVIKRDIFNKGAYQQPFRLSRHEDYYFLIRTLSFANKFDYVPDHLYFIECDNALSITHTKTGNDIKSLLYVGDSVEKFLKEQNKYEENKDTCIRFQLSTKIGLISSLDYWDPAKWRALWPNIHNEIKLPFKSRIYYKLIDWRLDRFALCICKVRNFMKRFSQH